MEAKDEKREKKRDFFIFFQALLDWLRSFCFANLVLSEELVLPIGFSPGAAPANGLAQERSAVKSRGKTQMLNFSARTLPAPLSLSVRQGNDVAD